MAKIVIDARELRTSTGRYVERLLHYLQQIDHDNSYRVLLKPSDMESWTASNKKFIKVECPYKEFSWSEQIDLLRQIRKLKPNLVHFAMTQQPVLYRGKVVTTMHDLTTARFRNPTKNWFVFTFMQWVYKWVSKHVANKSKIIIVPTEFVKDDVARFARVNSRKIIVTYEAADRISNTPESVEGLEDSQFIMYVGRPQPHKNLDRLQEAFTRLQSDHPDLKLVLAGKKDILYRKMSFKLKAHGTRNVIFTGFVSEGQLRWLYEHTTAYIFPSLSEGFGLPGLEAMVHGAPVVSSNATCLPEVYGDAAEYFDPLSVGDMAQAINKVLKNEKRRKQLIGLGRKQAAKYSWRRMAEQTLAVYQDALGESAAAETKN
jgi:glycosyltransferase involved in cell wall biosynthesis